MVSGALAVQALLIVQREGWFGRLSALEIARVWLASGREGTGLARAVRLVREEDEEDIARISRELDEAELREEVPPVFFAGFHEDSDGHFVPDSSEFWSDSD